MKKILSTLFLFIFISIILSCNSGSNKFESIAKQYDSILNKIENNDSLLIAKNKFIDDNSYWIMSKIVPRGSYNYFIVEKRNLEVRLNTFVIAMPFCWGDIDSCEVKFSDASGSSVIVTGHTHWANPVTWELDGKRGIDNQNIRIDINDELDKFMKSWTDSSKITYQVMNPTFNKYFNKVPISDNPHEYSAEIYQQDMVQILRIRNLYHQFLNIK